MAAAVPAEAGPIGEHKGGPVDGLLFAVLPDFRQQLVFHAKGIVFVLLRCQGFHALLIGLHPQVVHPLVLPAVYFQLRQVAGIRRRLLLILFLRRLDNMLLRILRILCCYRRLRLHRLFWLFAAGGQQDCQQAAQDPYSLAHGFSLLSLFCGQYSRFPFSCQNQGEGPPLGRPPFYRKKPLLQNGAGAFGVFAREKIKPAR